jgi:hypothetical protein
MVKNSLNQGSGSLKRRYPKSPHKVIRQPEEILPPAKNHYFDNVKVERLLYTYHETACCDVRLRDDIMSNASELIRQIIRANNLQSIYPGGEVHSSGDLFQVAWTQIESVLYKYKAAPHCLGCFNQNRPQDSLLLVINPEEDIILYEVLSKKVKSCAQCGFKVEKEYVYYRGLSKVFNMWSQIARTVGLAHIKREKRDRANSGSYQNHLSRKYKPSSYLFDRFITEANDMFKYNENYADLIIILKELYDNDDKAHEGLISKLVGKSGKSRATITEFLKIIRLRSLEFTDSPANDKPDKVIQNYQQHRQSSIADDD